MGEKEEQASHEFRQVVQIPETILQKRYHEENESAAATRLPVLHSLSPIKVLTTYILTH